MFLHHYHYLIYVEVSCHPNLLSFPNHLHSLTSWNTEMAQMAQQPILQMKINDNCVCVQHLVGSEEVKIFLIELGPSGGLMSVGV
jgi:hypothetical protein